MSLINDALKKAQKMREEGIPSDDATPGSGTEPLQRVTRREKPAGFRSQLMLLVGAAAAVLVLGVGAMFFFRAKEPAPAAPPSPQVAATHEPAATPAPAAAVPAPTPPAIAAATPPPTTTPPAATPTPLPTQTPGVVSAPTTNPPPTGAESAPSQFVIQSPPAATTTGPAITTLADRTKPSTRMIGVIEHYKVGGIRVAGAESKVLMNDKVFRLGDTVDHELGIRLTTIEIKALTFEDERGAVYTRHF